MVPALRKILIINPNSTRSMTNALKPLVDSLGYSSTQHTYFTAPSGPTSINSEDDAAESARHCLEPLLPLLETHDAFLVCCYSAHPLVGQLKARPEIAGRRKPVTGIFEASISSSLQAIGPGERFGIVSTGKVWEATLREAVDNYLGVEDNTEGSAAFAGVQTTGLNATELHDTSPVEVRSRMKKAVARLLMDDAGGPVGAVCLGCAGMAGFDDMVREAAIETLGHGQGSKVRIVDGVVAGVTWLEGALRSGMSNLVIRKHTMATTETKTKTFKSHPIESWDDGMSPIYTHLHPLLLLGLFYYQFPSLVEKPVDTLPQTALGVATLQLVYLCICIPGSNQAQLPQRGKKKGKMTQNHQGDTGIGAKLVPGILSLILAVTLGAPLIAIVLILFGAPLTTHQAHTLYCGLHISLLAAYPLFYVHGVDAAKWIEVGALAAPIDEVFGATVGTLIGAWVGAIPIPLDWDREWQKWPVTILAGAYIGYAVGKVVGGSLLKGSKIKIA
ncbi:GPI-anchor biosynthesis protein-like protein, partial [Aureobasidium melanogenum]